MLIQTLTATSVKPAASGDDSRRPVLNYGSSMQLPAYIPRYDQQPSAQKFAIHQLVTDNISLCETNDSAGLLSTLMALMNQRQ